MPQALRSGRMPSRAGAFRAALGLSHAMRGCRARQRVVISAHRLAEINTLHHERSAAMSTDVIIFDIAFFAVPPQCSSAARVRLSTSRIRCARRCSCGPRGGGIRRIRRRELHVHVRVAGLHMRVLVTRSLETRSHSMRIHTPLQSVSGECCISRQVLRHRRGDGEPLTGEINRLQI